MFDSEDIQALIRMFEQSNWKELEFNLGDSDIFLSKTTNGRASWSASPKGHATSPASLPPTAASVPAAPAQPTLPAGNVERASLPEGCAHVTAPSLGTFFRAAKPGAPPLVEVGQTIEADTELCLIEVMKLFTTLRSGVAGSVVEVLAKDGDLVEFGQPLFMIKLDG